GLRTDRNHRRRRDGQAEPRPRQRGLHPPLHDARLPVPPRSPRALHRRALMATAHRGTKSHTHDTTEVPSVDLETLTIAYRDVAHAADQQVRLDVPPTPAARQTLWGMADSISVHGTGMWESGYALQGIASTVKRSLLLLDDVGVSDFSEPSLALRQLRDVIEYFDASQKRTLKQAVLSHPSALPPGRHRASARSVAHELHGQGVERRALRRCRSRRHPLRCPRALHRGVQGPTGPAHAARLRHLRPQLAEDPGRADHR